MLHAIFVYNRKIKNYFQSESDLISAIIASNSALYYHEFKSASDIVEKLIVTWPKNLHLWRAKLMADYYADPQHYHLPNLLKRIARDPEVALIRAEIALREHQIGNILRHMSTCVRGTRNGLILRRLLEIGAQVQKMLYQYMPCRSDLQTCLQRILAKAADTLGEPDLSASKGCPILPSANLFPIASEKIAATIRKHALTALYKQYSLLQELTNLCETCGVRYYLFGDALRFAFTKRSLDTGTVRLSIAVDARECRKLLNNYKQHIRPRRYLESPACNPDFPEFALYYGDVNTLEMDNITYGFLQHHGMHIDVKILPVEQSSVWRKRLRTLAETTWAMEHGLMAATIGRLCFHVLLSVCRLIMGKKRVANWLFRKIFLRGKRVYGPKERYHIFWKKKFLLLPTAWFSGCQSANLQEQSFPVPRSANIPMLLQKLYGAKGTSIDFLSQPTVDPFHIVSPTHPYADFYEYLTHSEWDIANTWKQHLFIIRFGWLRQFFRKKLARDWNYLQFLNERYRMYKAVLPLKKNIMYCLARGNTKKLNQLMGSPVMRTCLKKTEQYMKQDLCFNFDSEMFNVVIEHFRSKHMFKNVKHLLRLNKKQKYPKITRKDVMEEDTSL